MITESQRSERVNYIGSSDSSAILGLSRYSSPLKIWSEKTGVIPSEDISKKLQVRLGNILEDTVAKLFEEETGKKVARVNQTIHHKDYPFIASNIDRRVFGEKAILEAKTTSAYNKDQWKDGQIPQEYLCQVYHQLACTGWDRAYLACLVGNTDFIWKEIPRDDAIIDDMIKKEVQFWNSFVLTKEMPQVVTSHDQPVLNKLFPHALEGKEISLSVEADNIILDIEGDEKTIELFQSRVDENRNKLRLMLGENESGKSDKNIVYWKNRSTRRLNTDLIKEERPDVYAKYLKETSTRYLDIKPVRGE